MSPNFHQRLQIDSIQLQLLFIDVKHSSSRKEDFYRTIINNNNNNMSVVLLGRGEVHGRKTCMLLCETSQFGVVFRAFIIESVQVKLGYRQAACLKCLHLFFYWRSGTHSGSKSRMHFLRSEWTTGFQNDNRRVDSPWELQVEVPRATKHGCLKRAAMILGILLICKFVFNFSHCKTRF